MASVILHIGPPKTGTTSIQSFLHLHRSALLNLGFIYPDQVNHQEIFNYFKYGYADEPKILTEALYHTKRLDGKLIISCEFFSAFTTQDFCNLKRYFNKKGIEDVKVFFLVREPTFITLSSRQELLKKGLTFNAPELSGVAMRYSELWGRVARAFDDKEIIFSAYREARFDVVSEFLKIFEIDIPYRKKVIKNTSLSFQECCLISYLNNHSIDYNLKVLRKYFIALKTDPFGGWESEKNFLLDDSEKECLWIRNNTNLEIETVESSFEWYKEDDYLNSLTLLKDINIIPSFFTLKPLSLKDS